MCGSGRHAAWVLRDRRGFLRKHRRVLYLPLARGPPMLPGATLPAARYYVTPGRRRRSCAGPRPAPRRGARRKRPARDAEAGLAEVMAMPAIWKDAGGRLLELAGPGSGIVACGALPGAAAPGPAWTAEHLAAAGIAGEPGPVREGTGLGLASAVLTPALLDQALAGVPARRRGRSRRGWRCRWPWRGRWTR